MKLFLHLLVTTYSMIFAFKHTNNEVSWLLFTVVMAFIMNCIVQGWWTAQTRKS